MKLAKIWIVGLIALLLVAGLMLVSVSCSGMGACGIKKGGCDVVGFALAGDPVALCGDTSCNVVRAVMIYDEMLMLAAKCDC